MPRKTASIGFAMHLGSRASMRPRPDAAENILFGSRAVVARRASMRPRPDAAENARPFQYPVRPHPRFNEAAARCRGKRGRAGLLLAVAVVLQ